MSVYKICRVFRALPYPGGVMNQPKGTISRLLALIEANDKIDEERSKETT